MPKLLSCPYCCVGVIFRDNKKRPNTHGKYKIQVTVTGILLLRCTKCRRTFKIKALAPILDDDDRLLSTLWK